jgi:moderate conductance mechanosensitive channel
MIEALLVVALDCVVVIAGAIGLVVALRFGRAALAALPMSRAARALVDRLSPVAGLALIAVYVVLAARWILDTGAPREQLGFAGVVALAAAASWSSLRDALEGVYLRAGRTLGVGDRVRIGELRGRVQRLGLRRATIETIDGELALVPYRQVAVATVFRDPGDDPGAELSAFHVFRVRIPDNRAIPEVKRIVREAALLCHWSSIARPPEVAAADDGHVEITVFPVDTDHVTDLERVVRRALPES